MRKLLVGLVAVLLVSAVRADIPPRDLDEVARQVWRSVIGKAEEIQKLSAGEKKTEAAEKKIADLDKEIDAELKKLTAAQKSDIRVLATRAEAKLKAHKTDDNGGLQQKAIDTVKAKVDKKTGSLPGPDSLGAGNRQSLFAGLALAVALAAAGLMFTRGRNAQR